jgi:DNA topoisomerase-3
VGKRLVIAEKPSVAKDIAAALGGFTDHTEYLESGDTVVTWAIGHLLELAEPQDYDKKYASWAIKNLPILPDAFQIKPKEGHQKRLNLIAKLGERPEVDALVNACDAGREGELIFRRIVDYCELGHLKQQRLWLQSMTKESIRSSFAHLRPGTELEPLADAAFCRAVGDWLVGMNATRALTQRLKSKGEQEAWSAGRVQTPTLGLIVAREREIHAHIPRDYWEILGKFEHVGRMWEARWWDPDARPAKEDEDENADAKPSRLFDRQRVDRIMAGLRDAKQARASEKRRKSKQNPPLPFDLTALQREANRRFGYSAKRTLDAAQRLYEQHKALTYPRTDSRYLPGDYGPTVAEMIDKLRAHGTLGGIAKIVRDEGPQNLDKLLDDTKVSDHFAIVPTGTLPEDGLRGDDEKVYELVVRQFFAALMGAATWATVERIAEVDLPATRSLPAEIAKFRATARNLEDPGFHRALGTKEDGSSLPPLVPGNDSPTGVGVDALEFTEEAKQTKPPGRYSEAQLLRMMETAGQHLADEELVEAMQGHGLGTPATRAETIEGLIRKGYCRRVDGKLGATSKAMRLMDIIERAHVDQLASPKLTGEWEFALSEVEHGHLTRADMLKRLAKFTTDVTSTLSTFEHASLYAHDASLGVCPSCGEGQVVETAWGYTCTLNTAKDSSCDFIIWKDRGGRYVDRLLAATLVRDRRAGPISGFIDRSGRSQDGTLILERNPEKENRWTLRIEYGDRAPGSNSGVEEVLGPLCDDPTDPAVKILETTRRYLSAPLYEKLVKSGPLLPRFICQREIQPEEALPYFGAEGKTDFLDGFTSKFNKPFSARLVREENGKHKFEFRAREGQPATADGAAEGATAAKRPARSGAAKRGAKADATAASEVASVKEAKAEAVKGAKAKAEAVKPKAEAVKPKAEAVKPKAEAVKPKAEAVKGAKPKTAKATGAKAAAAKPAEKAPPPKFTGPTTIVRGREVPPPSTPAPAPKATTARVGVRRRKADDE